MSEAMQEADTDQKDGRSDPSLSLASKPVGSGCSIIVSPRQVCIQIYTDFPLSLLLLLSIRATCSYITPCLMLFCPYQRGNPILKFVRSVPWEFGDIVPDYVLGQTTCALFLRQDFFLFCASRVLYVKVRKAKKDVHVYIEKQIMCTLYAFLLNYAFLIFPVLLFSSLFLSVMLFWFWFKA